MINRAVCIRPRFSFRMTFHLIRYFQGDWKISGLGLTIPLLQPDGSATRWEFPMFDGRIPTYIQRSFDYTGMPLSHSYDFEHPLKVR